MDVVTILLGLLAPLVPIAALVYVVRHGPFRNRWWKGETVQGFGLTLGAIGFAAGFFGPLIVAPEANQGPLLGIFITGPGALALGLVWGMVRAARRERAEASQGSAEEGVTKPH